MGADGQPSADDTDRIAAAQADTSGGADAQADAVDDCLAAYETGGTPDMHNERAAVRELLGALVQIAPGRSVEIRIPPHAVAQAVAGGAHRRGTPRATVECDPRTWIELAIGKITWAVAVAAGRVEASGPGSDLSRHLPLARRQAGRIR